MNARGIDFTGIAYLGALVIGAVIVYRVTKSGAGVVEGVRSAVGDAVTAAGKAVDAVNPTNPNNIFNRAFQPIADAFIKGGNPDETRNGSRLLHSFTAADQEDADMGAAMRALQRRPDWLNTAADIEDAESGAAMAAASGAAFYGNGKILRSVFK